MIEPWLLVSFIAPVCWALVNVIDLWMANEVFDDEVSATGIIGIFGGLPWLTVAFFGLPNIDIYYGVLSIIGGVLFAAFTFFYFRALFISDDITLVSIFMNLVGIVVPVLAALILFERLSLINYIGILLVFIGSMIACIDGVVARERLKKMIPPIAMAILALSLSMVAEEKVYSNVDFYGGLLYFSIGLFISGLFFYVLRSIKEKKLMTIDKGIGLTFVIAECVNIMAVVGSHYAINISPSVSFVAVIESTVPIFVLFISLLVFAYFSIFNKNSKYMVTLKSQFNGVGYKLIAIIFMAVGIYLIG